jgi:hypothetical protein
MFCTQCGAELHEGDSFCRQCGTPIHSGNDVVGQADTTLASAQPAEQAVSEQPAAYGPQGNEAPSAPDEASSASDEVASASASSDSGLGKGVKIAIAVIVAVAAVLVLLFTIYLPSKENVDTVAEESDSSTASSDASSTTGVMSFDATGIIINGVEVEPLDRPVISKLVVIDSKMPAAPALLAYTDTTASTSSQQTGTSTDSSTGTSGADNSTSGNSGTSGSAGSTSGSADSDTANTNASTSSDTSSGSSISTGSSTSSGSSTSASGSTSGSTSSGYRVATASDAALENPYGSVSQLTPESGLSNVVNADLVSGNSDLTSKLEQNMFAVRPGLDKTTSFPSTSSLEFFPGYKTQKEYEIPSFVTVDSMMHTYHLYYSHLLKNAEKDQLSSKMLSFSTTMLDESTKQLDQLRGTEWEEAAERNVVFFGVACRLLDPQASVPEDVESAVNTETEKITNAQATDTCLITGDIEDYSQYKPRGYYEGDETLERYFRAMMWYGRINFTQNDESLDRSALLITIAIDGSNHGTPNADWEAVYTLTSFFAGKSDDMTYYEYYPLFESCYGAGATVADLPGNESAWSTYHEATAYMPAPQITSLESTSQEETASTDDQKGFRVMGQRFTLDEAIFQQLVSDNVGTAGNKRTLPSAMDLPNTLGSSAAQTIEKNGDAYSYENFDSQVETMRSTIANSDESIWTESLYSQWLYTLNPLLSSKGEGYPAFMQSSEWDKKNLVTYLGSYTELKHDTTLYSKQIMDGLGGGGESPDRDDRGYVEPEPDVYARLANLAQATSDGLEMYGMLGQEDSDNLARLRDMATQLQTMSEKELRGEDLSDDEYDFIRNYGSDLEYFWKAANSTPDEPIGNASSTYLLKYPAAVVTDIATDSDQGVVLEEATGRVNTIYVLVPIDGELHLCEGYTYSYYEFTQDQSDRLDDSEWRTMLGISQGNTISSNLPEPPSWVSSFTTSAS